jgi:hypothetical protein
MNQGKKILQLQQKHVKNNTFNINYGDGDNNTNNNSNGDNNNFNKKN